MTVDDFDEPVPVAPGDRVAMEVFLNKLIIVRPVEYTDKMVTEYKPDGDEAVFANIACLDPMDGEPFKVFRKVLVMQGYLVGAFKGSLNKNLLGTIYLGEKKPGKKAPYMFQSLTGKAEVVARASEWLAQHRDKLIAAPVAPFEDPGKPSAETMRASGNGNPYMMTDEPPF